MGMSDEEPSKKMDEIRKFSAIYGRFDCKRKPEKPLTLHEVSFHFLTPCVIVYLKKLRRLQMLLAGLCERGSCPDLSSGSCDVDSQGRAFSTGSPGTRPNNVPYH